MILDHLDHHSPYRNLSPNIGRALSWLTAFTPQKPDGRYDLEGDRMYALVQSYTTAPATEKKYEAHRAYLDIQYLALGTEIILYAPVAGLSPATEYDVAKDYQLYHDPAHGISLPLSPGSFAFFYPHDAHKPGCIHDAASAIKKVVIKVLL